jgi:hypothetical protein
MFRIPNQTRQQLLIHKSGIGPKIKCVDVGDDIQHLLILSLRFFRKQFVGGGRLMGRKKTESKVNEKKARQNAWKKGNKIIRQSQKQ